MLNLDTRIPLMVQERDYGRGFDMMQKAQENQLRLQALRDEYNAAKEERDRQKVMRQGMASELQKMQQGTPAQYRTTFPQTMPTGQMPSGMTGVLASERGQNLPQPALFGENILQGNFDINRELVSPAIAPKKPDIKDILTAQFNAAVANNDVATAFDATKKLKELEKNPNKYFGGLTKGFDPKTNKPLFLAMTETGAVPVDGYQPYEEPMSPKEVKANDLAERKFRAEQAQKQKEYDLEYKKYIADLNKPDPVTQALTIAEGKEKIKQESEQRAKVAEKYADAESIEPILKQLISQLEKVPKTGIGRDIQSGLEYFGAGNEAAQNAMAEVKNTEALLVPFAQKQTGPQSDKDVQQYKEQVAAASNPLASASSRIAAAKNALMFAERVKKRYGNYASDILSGKVTPDELKTEPSKPTRSKDELFQLKKEYEFNRKKYKDDPEAIKILDSKARELGLIK